MSDVSLFPAAHPWIADSQSLISVIRIVLHETLDIELNDCIVTTGLTSSCHILNCYTEPSDLESVKVEDTTV